MNTKEVKDTTLMGKKKQELVEIIQNQDRKITSLVTERNDAFIEKACEWLKTNAGKYAFVDTDRIGNVADIDLELVQDFRKYME